jgi:hypothetical protein
MDSEFDLNDIMLEAVAEVQEIVRELMTELAIPRSRAQIGQAWASSPDEMKEQFAQERPDDYAALMSALEERRP